ncbi:MAG: 50S ribosomal protein L13 [Bacteroidales bacterium]|nr:50S ribosomal protein L13 [Bacteroidales bacterium]
MDTLSYKTISANAATVDKKWYIVDAEGEVLGRLASRVAFVLRGKHKTDFTPHADCGDNVIVINAEKIIVTGNKTTDKKYIRHTGYPGGQRERSFRELMTLKPTAAVEKAVKGMLPKNKLGSQLFRNLYVYEGAEHEQQAQKPVKLELNEIK